MKTLNKETIRKIVVESLGEISSGNPVKSRGNFAIVLMNGEEAWDGSKWVPIEEDDVASLVKNPSVKKYETLQQCQVEAQHNWEDVVKYGGEYVVQNNGAALAKVVDLTGGDRMKMVEEAPPGMEKDVKALKKVTKGKTYVDDSGERKESNPWAIAWASYNKKHGK